MLQEQFTLALQGLRLIQPGIVHKLGLVKRTGSHLVHPTLARGGVEGVWHVHRSGAYSLSEKAASQLPGFWAALNSPGVRNRQFLQVALRRFGLACERIYPEDALLDLMIAAEALFLTDVGDDKYRGELRFRLALRAAMFIDSDDRRATFRAIRLAYDLRSQLVHGGTPPSPPEPYLTIQSFNLALEGLIRSALLRYCVAAAGAPGRGSILPPDEDVLATPRADSSDSSAANCGRESRPPSS